MATSVVVIHGVGQSNPASVGSDLAQTLGMQFTQQNTVSVDGHAFIEFIEEQTGHSIIEVNWADILRPKDSVIGVMRHFWFLFTGMLDVAAGPLKNDSLSISKIYRWLLLVISPTASMFVICTAVAASVNDIALKFYLLGSITVFFIFMLWWTWNQGMHFKWLFISALALIIFTVVYTQRSLGSGSQVVSIALSVRHYTFLATMGTLTVAIILCLWKKGAWTVRLANMALLYIPYIVMNGFFSWLTFLVMAFISDHSDPLKYRDWENCITPEFDYGAVELVTTKIIGSLGLLSIIIPVLGYLLIRPRTKLPINKKGYGAQTGAVIVLAIAPFALLFLEIDVISISSIKTTADMDLVEIYRISIARTLPYLLWFVGPFAVVFDIVGDVIFYLQPDPHHPAAIAEKCRNRFLAALRYARQKPNQHIVILAHSQGSVIVTDVNPALLEGIPLVTMGSPVEVLYKRLIGKETEMDRKNWTNLFRDGDVLGGPIDGTKNVYIGKGGHTDYWKVDEIKKYIPLT